MSNLVAKPEISLKTVLTRHTKVELLDICRSLKIKGVSRFKKPRLIATMCRHIPDIMTEKMESWDQSTYDLMHHITTLPKVHYLETADDLFALDYFLDEYFCFHAFDELGDYVIIPREIQALFWAKNGRDFQTRVRVNTEVARLSKGLLHYYGYLPADDMALAVNELLPKKLANPRVLAVLWEVGSYNWDIHSDQESLWDARMTDRDYVVSELTAREELPYRHLSYDEIWQAGDPNYYVDQAEEVQDIILFLKEQGVGDDAFFFMELLFSLVQTELSPPEVVFALAEYLEVSESDLTELALMVFDYYHYAPHWVLKGHSPEEIMDQANEVQGPLVQVHDRSRATVYDFATGQELSGDSPCPCGSGRPFKDCCGSE